MQSHEPQQHKPDARAVSAAPTELLFFVHVYPGFHFGLYPHCTLGFAGVSCLKALVINPNFDALALGSNTGQVIYTPKCFLSNFFGAYHTTTSTRTHIDFGLVGEKPCKGDTPA